MPAEPVSSLAGPLFRPTKVKPRVVPRATYIPPTSFMQAARWDGAVWTLPPRHSVSTGVSLTRARAAHSAYGADLLHCLPATPQLHGKPASALLAGDIGKPADRPWLPLGLAVGQPVLPGSPGLGRRAFATATGADAGEVGGDGGSGHFLPRRLHPSCVDSIEGSPSGCRFVWPKQFPPRLKYRLPRSNMFAHTPNPSTRIGPCKGTPAGRVSHVRTAT